MDRIAAEYVRLVLAVGGHDENYVDAYYGPPEWKTQAETERASLKAIRERATKARAEMESLVPPVDDRIGTLRWRSLAKGLEALAARVDFLSGVPMTFDEESAALYDVVAPERPDAEYAEVVARLEALLPGEGPLGERLERMREPFYVPADRQAAVFEAAIEAARERTKRHIPLPENESFRTEFVQDRAWGAYNWYKGDAYSLIQVNTDSPFAIGGAVGLACHEGYPGHHVYNALLERDLARGRGWVEFTVYPLFSPQSLIAEGTAEYGVELCFSKEEKLAFEKETLFPIAGLDPEGYDAYVQAQALARDLGTASNDAARRYLDGKASREETVAWLVRHALSTPERATRSIRFFEQNRSYVVTYNLGLNLVRDYIESRATAPQERWRLFAELLSTPQVPSNLRERQA